MHPLRLFRIKEEAPNIIPPAESVANVTEIPSIPPAAAAQFHREVGEKFTDFFLKKVPDLKQFDEFIYGIDNLAEIAKGIYWDEPGALNNRDIDNLVGPRFKLTAQMLMDPRLKGVTVPQETYDLIGEFFDHDYLFIIGQLIDRATGVGIIQFPFYKQNIQLTIRRLPFPDFYSLLEFKDDFTGKSICFAFYSERLTQRSE